MKEHKEECRNIWVGRTPFLLLMLFVAMTSMAGQPGRKKNSKQTSEKLQLTAIGPSGSDQVLTSVYDPTANALRVEGSSSGSISVGLSLPSEFSVTGSPVTSTGVLGINWAQPVSIAHGGTGETTTAAAFNALAPATSAGGLIYGTGTNTYGNLSLGPAGECLQSNATTLVWGSCGTSITLGGDLSGTSTSQTVVGLQGRPLSASAPASGQILQWNGSAWGPATLSGSGTVTTVGLALPSIFTVTGSPVTGSGTLTGALANESANTIFAGPSSGAAAAPTFRALVAGDIPALNYQAPLSSFSAPANEFLTSFTSPNTFTAAQPSFLNLAGTATMSQLPSTIPQFTGAITAGDCAKWSSSGMLADAGAACGTGAGGGFTAGGDLSGTSTSQTVVGLQGHVVSSTAPATGQALEWNGTAWAPATLAGSSTGTSVGLALPSIFTVTGSPVTGSGTLTGALATQNTNLVFASPNGAAGTPSFRSLALADLPAINFTNLTGLLADAQLPADAARFTGTITAGDCVKWSSSGVLADAGAACSTGSASGAGSAIALQFGTTAETLSSSAPSSGQVLEWNGTNIVGATVSAFSSENNNAVFAGPATSGSGAPSFRSLVTADLPTVDFAHGGTGQTTAQAALDALLPGSFARGSFIVGDGPLSATQLPAGLPGQTLETLYDTSDYSAWSSFQTMSVPNNTSPGTTLYTLVKLATGGTGTTSAVEATTSDTNVPVYIFSDNPGTSGNGALATTGAAPCIFDAAPAALGDYVVASTTTASDCHDAGSAMPSSGYIVGRVYSTTAFSGNGSAYYVVVEPSNETGGSGMANPMTTAGDMIVGGASGAPARLALGSSGQCLQSNGTTAVYGACGTSSNATQIQGVNVASTAPTSGQVLQYNGTDWTPTTPAAGSNTTYAITSPVTLTSGGTSGNVEIGTGFSIPASQIGSVGTVIEIEAFGVTTTGATAQSEEFFPEANSTIIGRDSSQTQITIPGSTTNASWEYRGQCIVDSTGTSGTMECQGDMSINSAPTSQTQGATVFPSNAAATVTVNTTAALSLGMWLDATSSGIVSGNSVSLRQFIVRVVH